MNISSGKYLKTKNNPFPISVRIKDIKSTFRFRITLATRIQQIIIQICDKIGIDHLKSNVQIYKGFNPLPLKKAATAKLEGIRPNDTLKCKIHSSNAGWTYYSKTHDFETVAEYKKYLPKKYIMPGINFEAMCVNPQCVEYGKLKVQPKGSGHFNINETYSNLKCVNCPDRDKGTNPPMAVKRVIFVSCYWRYEGDMIGKSGFETRKFNKGWVKVENCD